MKQFITSTILEAGKEVMKMFDNSTILYSKETVVHIVTDADLLSNKIITEAIKAKFPDHSIFSEESEQDSSAEYVA